jgi:excisionase family DNA binding protein
MQPGDLLEGTLVPESQPTDDDSPTTGRVHPAARLDTLPNVLTPSEAAQVLRLSRNTMYEVIKTGRLATVRIGRKILIPRAALIRFLEG